MLLGTICHEALHDIFDYQPQNRTLENLQSLFCASWECHCKTKVGRNVFGTHPGCGNSERKWKGEGLMRMENYFRMEDPKEVVILEREMPRVAKLSLDPTKGITGYASSHEPATPSNRTETFTVPFRVDRVDLIRLSEFDVALRIMDYKTGKAPDFRYSIATNEKIAKEEMYQLMIYALLLRESRAGARFLTLMYLTSESGGEYCLNMDLGETQKERDVVLQEVHAGLARAWTEIYGFGMNH